MKQFRSFLDREKNHIELYKMVESKPHFQMVVHWFMFFKMFLSCTFFGQIVLIQDFFWHQKLCYSEVFWLLNMNLLKMNLLKKPKSVLKNLRLAFEVEIRKEEPGLWGPHGKMQVETGFLPTGGIFRIGGCPVGTGWQGFFAYSFRKSSLLFWHCFIFQVFLWSDMFN